MLDPTRADAAAGPGIVVGVAADRERGVAAEAALAVQTGLDAVFPDVAKIAVVLSSEAEGTVEPGTPLERGGGGRAAPAIHAGAGGPEAALHTLLEVAVATGAPACALLEPMPRPADPIWLRSLLDPVLRGSADLVAPSYQRRRFEGVLVSGLVYPLTRALFGQRIRQPLGTEMVLSRRLVEQLWKDDEWRTEPAYAGSELWAITKALVRDCRCAQVFLGPRPVPQRQPAHLPDALAQVLGTLFHEMEVNAARWQRVRGSCAVDTYGDEHLPGETAPPPPVAPPVEAFALGRRDLLPLWSAVLPPNSLLALRRLSVDPPESFRFPDALWARVVYDFAVGWRTKVMDRPQLLRSLTPLYMGWLGGFVNEVGPVDRLEKEARVERLCEAFEAEKPYLISRWRWPDRFTP
ncbi:MAG TPA: hypothetical protein VFL83_20310 [Anaeromyxobacter sp.]|nr:hypothetical protein [Anaeromyxobacter sp.]